MQIIRGIKDESIKKIKTEEKVAGSAEEESAILVSSVSAGGADPKHSCIYKEAHIRLWRKLQCRVLKSL